MKISEQQTYIDMSGRRVFINKRMKLQGKDGVQNTFWTYIGYQVDREGNRISDARGWKSDGRDWVGDMMGAIVREASVGLKVSDGQAVVLERLIEALETDLALPVRVGPRMFGNAMPDVVLGAADIFTLEVGELIDNGGVQTRQRHQAINDVTARKALCSRGRITRMEEAFAWFSMIFDDEDRRILMAYAEVKAKKQEWERYIEKRNRRFPTKDAWVKRTIMRRIGKILQEVETKLRKSDIILRDGAGLQVAHEAA